MKKTLLTKVMLLLCALIAGSSSVWAGEPETIWSENFDGLAADATPTAPTNDAYTGVTYTCTNGTGTSPGSTKIMNDNLANGAGSPELMIGKKGSGDGAAGGKFTVVIPLDNYEGTLTLTYCQNKQTLKVSSPTAGVSGGQTLKPAAAGQQTTTFTGITSAMTSITIEFQATTTSNVRLDDIVLTGTKASGKTPTTVTINGTPSTEVYMGDEVTSPTSATVKAGETTVGSTVTWSSSNTSVATINESTGVISLVGPGSTTIKATFAEDATYNGSEASYELKVYGVFTTMTELQAGCAAYGNTAMKGKMTFANVYVTAVKGYSAYISDGTNGAVIYKNGHGFAAGDKLACSALEMTMMNYNSYTPEITSLNKSTEGLTVTSGQTITPTSLAVNAITTANFGTLVKISNVTYDATNKVFKDASDNAIAYYDNFTANPTLNDGEEYDVTGVILFKNSTTVEICPRSAEDVKAKFVKTDPTSQWKNGEDALTEIMINKVEGTKKYTFETDSDGDITYSSSVEAVATIASDGTITPVGYGTTIITANVESTATYNADSKSFTLKVVDAGVDVIEIANVTFASGSSYQYWTNVDGLTTAANYTGQSMTGQSYIQIRNQSPAGIVTTASAGRVQKVSVKWAGSNTNNRYLTIYGKNSAYNKSDDLYGENKGDELGRITFKTGDSDGELEIPGNYGFIGIIASGAMYIGQLQIKWDDNVSIAIGESKFTTFSFSSAVDFSGTDVTAYTAKVEGNVAKLTPITGNIVPANTGVILGADASGNYTGEVTTGGSVGDNELVAVSSDEAIEYEAGEGKYNYILQKNANTLEFGFYRATGAKLKAGKAYLRTTYNIAGAPCLKLEIEGDMTGINTVNGSGLKVNDEYYNLAGQRVAQPTKGLYIVNGKKIVVK